MTHYSLKILLVDDDEDDFIITRNLLSEAQGVHYNIDWIVSYEDALEIIGQKKYDVYLFDYRLGEHTGLELLHEVTKKDCASPIILLTGQGDHEIDIEAMKAGASDYLVKGEMSFSLIERSIRYAIERKKAEAQILQLAYYDNLTSLPNRKLFTDRLRQAILLAERYDRMVGLLFLDLDNFKNINDSLGHEAGDSLLQKVSECLRQCLRKTDTIARPEADDTIVARLGGDEFIVLLTEIKHSYDAAIVAQRILDALSTPFFLKSQEVYITFSIGIALYPTDGKDINTLLKNADVAMYHAKNEGKNNYQFYERPMNAAALKKLTFENHLRKSLENDEFILHYQPKMDISTGKILSTEALLRWQSATMGMISPADFIPLAEETGLIIPIGEWVMQKACLQNTILQKAGFDPLHISVNVSIKQLKQKNFTKTVTEAIEKSGINPQHLELEITESIFLEDIHAIITTLKELKETGLKLSMDDFGVGYSSFRYLKNIPLDVIKIDRSFVKDVTNQSKDAAIVTAIIAMAHTLNIKVIAEGVETEEQLAFLYSKKCDEMQGFLLSKPLPIDELTRFLKREREGNGQGVSLVRNIMKKNGVTP